jgi:hypothetical protein
MPLVLTQNEATQSGHSYADQLGVEYEYPTMYRNLIRTGRAFVYYRGRQRAGGGRQPQVYLGVGVIGDIRPSPNSGRLICTVEDVELFGSPVPFKLDGEHLEPLGGISPSVAGRYFQRGVREIDDETFRRILAVGEAGDPTAGRRRREAALPYAPPETARLVDEIAVELALAELRARYPTAQLTEMPHNNPGYDVRVREGGNVIRYVEVKGTLRGEPHFFMSEGERLFSHENAARYSLLVFYAIDRLRRTGALLARDGGVAGDDVTLRATHWKATIRSAAAG